MKQLLSLGAAALLAVGVPCATYAGVPGDVQTQCGGCHTFNHDYASQPVTERMERKGPVLDYAGNKFQRTWLVAWLQNPVRIRPAGEFPPDHVKSGPDGKDVVDTSTLLKHPVLSSAQAGTTADYLMTLKPFDNLIKAETYQPGTISPRMGEMNFVKFRGCGACHQHAPGKGGLSGPELYTAWKRLQPAFIASYISNDIAWDPHTMMPKGNLSQSSVKKLANYLKVIGEK